MGIPPIVGKPTDPDMTPFKESISSQQDERLTKVVKDALHAAWDVSPGKKLKVEGYVRHLFDEATHSLMDDISLQLRERVKDESKLPNVACEELGRIASQKAAEEGLLLHGFFVESGNTKAQKGLIKLLLATDLVGELGLQLDKDKISKIEEAFEWAIAAAEGKEEVSSDLQILNEAIFVSEGSLVDLLAVGYPFVTKA
jgi:hypothetical protein